MDYDFEVYNDISIHTVTPNTDSAKTWLTNNLSDEVTYWGDGVAVESRYIEDLCTGILNDGLTIGVSGKQMILTQDDDLVLV